MANKRIKDLSTNATETDLVSGNYLAIDGSAGTKRLAGDAIAPKSVQTGLTADGNHKLQVYSYSDLGWYVEEDTTNKKVFFKCNAQWKIRGAALLDKTNSDIATDCGTSLVTSTKGEANCLEIPDENSLVFDSKLNKIQIKNRSNVSYTDYVILGQNGGYVVQIGTALCYDLLKNVYPSLEYSLGISLERRLQIYAQGGGKFYLESDTTNQKLFIKSTTQWTIRGAVSLDKSNSDIATDCSTTLVTSTSGVANCIEIGNEYSLVFDGTIKKLQIKHRTNVASSDIVFVAQNGGRIVQINSYLLMFYLSDSISELSSDINRKIIGTANCKLQLYTYQNGGWYIEEDTTNKKVFIKASVYWMFRGVLNTMKTNSEIATDCGTTIVTSTKGVTGCLAIPDENALVFDNSTNKLNIKHRNNLTSDDYVLLCQNGGYLTSITQLMLKDYIFARVQTATGNASDPATFYPNELKQEIANIKEHSDFTFAFFTDVHASITNVSRIVSVCNAVGVDAILNGGDSVLNLITDGLSSYNSAVNASDAPVLNVAGNHDAWTGSAWNWANATDVYNLIMPQVISKSSPIVQPADAAANGLVYYYKDFDDIRVICLNGYHYWDATQKNWLISVLADAITNSKKVIAVNHYPFVKANGQFFEKGWNSWMDYKTSPYSDSACLDNEAVLAVKDFIDAGGTFIGWFSGHAHWDGTIYNDLDNRQFMLNAASARYDKHRDGAYVSSTDTSDPRFDCFTLCGVDLTNSMIKFLRIGWNKDSAMQFRNGFAWNFSTRKIIQHP